MGLASLTSGGTEYIQYIITCKIQINYMEFRKIIVGGKNPLLRKKIRISK